MKQIFCLYLLFISTLLYSQITIINDPCSKCAINAEFSYSNPVQINTTIDFAVKSSIRPNLNCPIISQFWSFGNGEESKELKPSMVYKSVGKYEVCLTIFYESDRQLNCSVTSCEILFVQPDWENCDPLININSRTTLSGASIKAGQIIVSSVIPKGEKVQLDAAEFVELQSGFEVQSGAELEIKNEPCDNCDHQVLFKDAKVNPAFKQNPPLASNINIEILPENTNCGENIRLVANLAESGISQTFHAVLIDDEKIVLSDDGQGADKKAGDGLFSVFLKEDVEKLQNELIQRKNGLLEGERVIFDNRSIKPINRTPILNTDLTEVLPNNNLDIPADFFSGGTSKKLDPFKTLLIRDVGVVEDTDRTINPCTQKGMENGVWTFGYLMQQLASPATGPLVSDVNLSTFVLKWLNKWMVDQTVNGELLPKRTAIDSEIIQPWLAKSAQDGAPAGQLKMKFAPFRLLAIVNRVDLRGSSGYGFSNAGEGRFVFCALDESCNPLEFTVIFEYGVNKKNCNDIKAYAQEWADLNKLTLGSVAYNAALENITKQFTDRSTNFLKRSGNSLNQLRTNEIALSIPWELREFIQGGFVLNINAATPLRLTTVKQEPALKYNVKQNNTDVATLVDFINNHVPPIKNNNYTVPQTHNGANFLGGKAHTEFPPTGSSNVHHWDGEPIGPPVGPSITNDQDRHVFSLNTCSGCHGGETQTFFTHIDPTAFGQPAGLSGFLTGEPGRGVPGFLPVDADGSANSIMTVNDAAGRGAPHQYQFNDLARREADLNNLLSKPCKTLPSLELAEILIASPIRMVH